MQNPTSFKLQKSSLRDDSVCLCSLCACVSVCFHQNRVVSQTQFNLPPRNPQSLQKSTFVFKIYIYKNLVEGGRLGEGEVWFFSVSIINDICCSLELQFACSVLSACPSFLVMRGNHCINLLSSHKPFQESSFNSFRTSFFRIHRYVFFSKKK